MNKIVFKRFETVSYPVNEALNTLATNLSFVGLGVKKIMITSAQASEGKSFISMNLMRKMVERGKRVVLVDADLRRSVIARTFAVQFETGEKGYGLSHYLAGIAEKEDIVYQTNIPNAFIVPVGKSVPNPIPLLLTGRFRELLNTLAEQYDYVIVDAAPVGVVIDAAEVARSCDGTLLVVGYDQVHRQELLEVKRQLEQTGVPILGAILNQVEYKGYTGKKYYYKKYYYNKYQYYNHDVSDEAQK
ncbi:MAG: CpsD/CapB family tyrosine-protein kinase [Faecalibacterium sp.]|nr:CpsD/CapB family tyrosine-protein kinase [Faecalibacterium sp.]